MKSFLLKFSFLILSVCILLSSCSEEEGTPEPVADPGTITGIVKDAITGNPIAGVSIQVKRGNNKVAEGLTDDEGSYEISVPAGEDFTVTFQRTDYREVLYSQVNVLSNVITYLAVVLQIDSDATGACDISGQITDALTGQGASGLSLKLRAGINASTGNVIAEGFTGADGAYTFSNIPVGNYTIEAKGTDYNTLYLTVICVGSGSSGGQNGTISPISDNAKFRIVLSWGAEPSDLDAHLTGPIAGSTDSTDRFHIYFSNKTPFDVAAQLDVDDVSSFGPETITITEVLQGVYRYSVHDYSFGSFSSSTSLARSSARVRVFQEGNQVADFNVPNKEGTLWTVFEITNGVLVPINTLSYESTSSNVRRPSGAANTDGAVIKNQSKK
ncbi:MAG: carboxypeptidase regulatory-like domain-containing protein [Microscillaceae bacterium]|nr:carboxypeptidase regulatory-like domain-containing protein [Microscillaceae bacterium]